MTELEDIKKQFNELALKIKELENKEALEERWNPVIDDKYCYISSNGYLVLTRYCQCIAHKQRFDAFNIFKTSEEAEKERDIRLAWLQLRELGRQSKLKRDKKYNSPGHEARGHHSTILSIGFYSAEDAECALKFIDNNPNLLSL